jgi:hypothetical protein
LIIACGKKKYDGRAPGTGPILLARAKFLNKLKHYFWKINFFNVRK